MALWGKRGRSDVPLFRFAERRKVGFVDGAGKVSIPAQFDADASETGDFLDGLARVRKERKWGYVDRTGSFVVPPRFSHAHDFSEGLASVMILNDPDYKGKVTYINSSGSIAIRLEGGYAGDFSEGLAAYREPYKQREHPKAKSYIGRLGYIDRTGSIVVEPQFADGGRFAEGLARVSIDGQCWFSGDTGRLAAPATGSYDTCSGPPKGVSGRCLQGFIDSDGSFAFPARFTDARDFRDGLAAVKVDGRWGYIDKTGEFAVEPIFEDAYSFNERRAAVRLNGSWGFIDQDGRNVILHKFDSVHSFSEGFAMVSEKGHCGFIDSLGVMQLPMSECSFVTSFVQGLSHVRVAHGHWAWMDRKGNFVFEYFGRDPFP